MLPSLSMPHQPSIGSDNGPQCNGIAEAWRPARVLRRRRPTGATGRASIKPGHRDETALPHGSRATASRKGSPGSRSIRCSGPGCCLNHRPMWERSPLRPSSALQGRTLPEAAQQGAAACARTSTPVHQGPNKVVMSVPAEPTPLPASCRARICNTLDHQAWPLCAGQGGDRLPAVGLVSSGMSAFRPHTAAAGIPVPKPGSALSPGLIQAVGPVIINRGFLTRCLPPPRKDPCLGVS